MLGAVVGDVIGSVYEGAGLKSKDFDIPSLADQFTDDSVMTVAMAHSLLTGIPYADAARRLGTEYPDTGFGGNFLKWLFRPTMGPYQSWGNGSAMRVSPVAWAFDSEAEVLREAAATAVFSHDHPEGIKGAQATALAIWLARQGCSKLEIKRRVEEFSAYDLGRHLDEIRPGYQFDVSCQGSVPEALIAFLESNDFEDAIRNAISLGGDTDTQAAIAGSVAEAYYGGVPEGLLDHALSVLSPTLLDITAAFCARFRPGPQTDRILARQTVVKSVLKRYARFEAIRLVELPDAVLVRFTAGTFGRNGQVIRRQLATLITQGWTRLCFDLGAIGELAATDIQTLLFVAGSAKRNFGCLVVQGLALDLQEQIKSTTAYQAWQFAMDEKDSRAILAEARNKTRIQRHFNPDPR